MRSDEDEDRRQFSEYFAYLMCGDWHWADDLAQTAFIRLAASWHKVRDRGALDAFVRTCLIRAYLAETRRVWRRRESSFAELPEPGAAAAAAGAAGVAAADDDAEAATRRLVFIRALGELPPRQRVTLICRYYQGLDVAETAATLNCSEGTVKSQTARGLAALRRILGCGRAGATGVRHEGIVMTDLRELLKQAAEGPAPASRLAADELYAAGRRRHRRRGILAGSAAAAAVLAVVAGLSAADHLVAQSQQGQPADRQDPVVRQDPRPGRSGPGAVIQWAGTADYQHIYLAYLHCERSSCRKDSFDLVGSDDGGRTWSDRATDMRALAPVSKSVTAIR